MVVRIKRLDDSNQEVATVSFAATLSQPARQKRNKNAQFVDNFVALSRAPVTAKEYKTCTGGSSTLARLASRWAAQFWQKCHCPAWWETPDTHENLKILKEKAGKGKWLTVLSNWKKRQRRAGTWTGGRASFLMGRECYCRIQPRPAGATAGVADKITPYRHRASHMLHFFSHISRGLFSATLSASDKRHPMPAQDHFAQPWLDHFYRLPHIMTKFSHSLRLTKGQTSFLNHMAFGHQYRPL